MKLTIVLIIALCGLAACTDEPAESVADLTIVQGLMTDSEAVARGEALFIGSCVDFCHTLEPADTDATFLFSCSWQQATDDAAISEAIKSGISNTRMVGFGSNFPEGDDDLWKLVAYLRFNQQPCE